MSISDSFAPFFDIIVLLTVAFILFACYLLWRFVQRQIYRLTQRRPKSLHFTGRISARLVPDREWAVDNANESEVEDPQAGTSDSDDQPLDSEALTDREKQVARLAMEGNSNKAIAKKLSISVGTVENHLTNIYRKLHIESRKELKYVPRDLLY